MLVSIGKNSLARAAAATGSRTAATEVAKAPVLRLVDPGAILPLKGKTIHAAVSDALIDSIATKGVLEPVLLAQTGPDEVRVLSGNRRVCAARQAGLTAIPAVILEMTQAEAVAAQKELKRFAAAPAEPQTTAVVEATAVGQAMPDWLL